MRVYPKGSGQSIISRFRGRYANVMQRVYTIGAIALFGFVVARGYILRKKISAGEIEKTHWEVLDPVSKYISVSNFGQNYQGGMMQADREKAPQVKIISMRNFRVVDTGVVPRTELTYKTPSQALTDIKAANMDKEENESSVD